MKTIQVNWGAWPNANSDKMASDTDEQYQEVLGDKSYMMGVSPYFYTNIRKAQEHTPLWDTHGAIHLAD